MSSILHRRRLLQAVNFLPNPTSEWKLEETSGTTVFDSVGTNNGTNSDISAVTTADGKINRGYSFNSPERNILIPYSTDFVFNDGTSNLPFSMCFWNKTIAATSVKIFARWYVGGTFTSEFLVQNNILRFRLWNQDGSMVEYYLTNSFDYPGGVDVWTHLGFVFDPSDTLPCKIFINGQSKPLTTNGTPTDIRVQNHTLRMGGLEREGVMDEIKWFKKALSDNEMLSIYNAEL